MVTFPYDPEKREITIDFKMEFVQVDMPRWQHLFMILNAKST